MTINFILIKIETFRSSLKVLTESNLHASRRCIEIEYLVTKYLLRQLPNKVKL